MLKHKFFTDFSAAPLASFETLAARWSKPRHQGKIAFVKKIARDLEAAVPVLKVRSA